MKIRTLCIAIIMLLQSNVSLAAKPVNDSAELLLNIVKNCRHTVDNKSVLNGKPTDIYKSNNLRRYQNTEVEASGDKIAIIGRVLDNHCQPVRNAIVEMWQVDCHGKSQQYCESVKAPLIKEDPNAEYTRMFKECDRFFTGSGTSVTDENGTYIFFTIMPATIHKTPYIDMSINSRELGILSVRHLLTTPLSMSDIPAALSNKLEDSSAIYRFDIVFSTENRYNRY
ncbi:putative dioxygenase [Candidatus Fokinia solitaria]|uniref:Putative dioxygenase n=1 Tax=Candidatus Fokinia solitaria TaxID=1802984 RepID=A0A2U8BRQ8_9RICK|nr:hypothetical protein [Candidatus Fokinia solitaria]AWD33022.1 putative dioxygenase [Candidatus Fokinia solitaria]